MDLPRLHRSADDSNEPKRPIITTAGLVALSIVFAFVILSFLAQMSWAGCGRTHLTVEFVVTDSETGRPISGATIDVTAFPTNLSSGKENLQFVTLASGQAFSSPIDVMTDEGQRFWHSWSHAYPPDWVYQVSAESYETTEPMTLPRNPQLKTGSKSHLLTVSVPMKRKY
jgi:hypothetical protein